MRLWLLIFFLCVSSAFSTENSAMRVQTIQLHSKVFGNTRTLRILLPAGYDSKPEQRYPVLYLNDGYAVFEYWKIPETVQDLTRKNSISDLIVVGIDNAGEAERGAEYLPYSDESNTQTITPLGSKYPQFLVDEVLPLIDRTFRTKRAAEGRCLGGASYGAYISLYTVIHRPGIFGALLIESTPLFISDFQIFKDAEQTNNWPARISIGVGSQETDDAEINSKIAENAHKLESIILMKSPSTKVRVFVQQGGSHSSESWTQRLPAALEFLYSTASP